MATKTEDGLSVSKPSQSSPGEECLAGGGEMGALFGLPRSAHALAVTDVEVTAYTAQAFRDLVGTKALTQMIAGAGPMPRLEE